ncbi:hypothetical protein VDG1235_466 [Verrucomicrobiia bacterium DG1235]|nr:hypothetical protein VDG1235_466 [Verrucomicrobiae bacterium DG1235]
MVNWMGDPALGLRDKHVSSLRSSVAVLTRSLGENWSGRLWRVGALRAVGF